MQFLKYTLILVCILVFSNGLIAGNNDPINDKPAVFEIEDKYKEVKLCLTKTSVYMKINSTVKDYMNQEIVHRHSIEASQFIDSEGHFLLGDVVLLSSRKLEYSFDDIESISFENGELIFTYNDTQSFVFSDILGTDGNPALQNFYLEDLEKFFIAYKKLTS
ncbi:MAG TPA: hypothetical protein DCL80_05605 [Balneola sp.]|jgi:hypothetical protein|nr:hypothetical protein [Bacteroidota bacterium]MAC04313.1 hypothetical protein [Balneola sp.]MAO78328.1 hypothetical protein [Balneola sp.]MBF64329.1 hypothetical protein [Balneola sp.]HAH50758.1 hypothetical protein [Balneola sp.]|tara:strand:- start:7965 stop:8450 length:486 start_codon:yes stop_codon:yes gene_type:complete